MENTLRLRAGQAGYDESFIEHYLMPIITVDVFDEADRGDEFRVAGDLVAIDDDGCRFGRVGAFRHHFAEGDSGTHPTGQRL